MIQTNYYIISGLSIFVVILCIANLHENDIFSRETIKKFMLLSYFVIFEIVLDTIFEYMTKETNTSRFVLHLLKMLELSTTPILPFLVLNVFYNDKSKSSKKRLGRIRILLLSLVLINIVLQILSSIYGDFIFFIDNNNVYHRGKYLILYVLVLFFSLTALFCGIIAFSKHTQNLMKHSLFCFFIIMCVGIFLRSTFSATNFDWLCISIALLLLLLYYSNIVMRTDPLTNLLNRRVYTQLIESLNYTTSIIMIDVNNFKTINDTYGHECGDQTLKSVAHLIFKAYSKFAYCFRIGGDEFCVILKAGVFEEFVQKTDHCDAYAMSEALTQKLDELILKQLETGDETIKYGVAQGYGIYYSPQSYPSLKERIPLEKVLKLADMRMYQAKKEFKKKNLEILQETNTNMRKRVLYRSDDIKLIDVEQEARLS